MKDSPLKDCLTAALVAIWFCGGGYFLISDDWRGIFVMFAAVALYKVYGEGVEMACRCGDFGDGRTGISARELTFPV